MEWSEDFLRKSCSNRYVAWEKVLQAKEVASVKVLQLGKP